MKNIYNSTLNIQAYGVNFDIIGCKTLLFDNYNFKYDITCTSNIHARKCTFRINDDDNSFILTNS